MRTLLSTALAALLALAALGTVSAAEPAESPSSKTAVSGSANEQAVRQAFQALTQAFNRGESKQLAAMFLPDAELIDEAGDAFRGQEEIAALFARFFEKFPGVKMEVNVDKIHLPSNNLAIVDGVRSVVTQDGSQKAATRFTMVYAQHGGQWGIASARELPEDNPATPHERLASLAWMVGEWVNEDPEAAMTISCRWSDNGNFLLVDFTANVKGKKALASEQRVGWDPLTQSVRSWVFDSDGGYGEGRWTEVGEQWVIKSTAIMPDGITGSATVVLEPTGKDKFVMKGRDRILGDTSQEDFVATIVRRPPQPSK